VGLEPAGEGKKLFKSHKVNISLFTWLFRCTRLTVVGPKANKQQQTYLTAHADRLLSAGTCSRGFIIIVIRRAAINHNTALDCTLMCAHNVNVTPARFFFLGSSRKTMRARRKKFKAQSQH
jgi:hypothetical protein